MCIGVQVVGFMFMVDSILDCEANCDAQPGCTATSFVSTLVDGSQANCFLKVIDRLCDLPEEATYWPRATFSIRKCSPIDAAAEPESNVPEVAPGPDPSSLGALASASFDGDVREAEPIPADGIAAPGFGNSTSTRESTSFLPHFLVPIP